MPNAQYIATNRGRPVDGRHLATGGHFVVNEPAPSGHAEYPKFLGDLVVHNAAEEAAVRAAEGRDLAEVRAELIVARQATRAALAEASVDRQAPRREFPKWITVNGRAAIVLDAEHERQVLGAFPGPAVEYRPSPAAREALAEAVAEGVAETESAILDKAVIAWAKWRKSAMRPGQRPARKPRGVANADAAPAGEPL